jgi:hypothetical protein
MNPNYRYSLSRSSKKHICPSCKQKSFTYFDDNLTGEELQDFGRCDRQDKCGYHQSPASDETPQYKPFPRAKPYLIQSKQAPVVFIPDAELDALRTPESIRESQFFKNMVNHGFTESLVLAVFNLYKVGALDGCAAFPYIDSNGGIRSVSLIGYGANNRRIKDSETWLHSSIQKKAGYNGFNYPSWLADYLAHQKQGGKITNVLFGEHLLNQYPSNPLNVVEAPKTAIIAALYFGTPNSKEDKETPVWVAVGALNRLSSEIVEMLVNEREKRGLRGVTLWPDLSEVKNLTPDVKRRGTAFEYWEAKSRGLLVMSTYLEDIATDKDRVQGKDLADFLWPCSNDAHLSDPIESSATTATTNKPSNEITPVGLVGSPVITKVGYSSEKSRKSSSSSHFSVSLEKTENIENSATILNDYFWLSDKTGSWLSGKTGKTYLMPDDQKWINGLFTTIDAGKRQDLTREHQSLFFDTYHQTVGSKLKKDEIARRKANTWLRLKHQSMCH